MSVGGEDMFESITSGAALWAFIGAVVTATFGAVVALIKVGPDRKRAANEAQQIKVSEADMIRSDYAEQLRELRAELHRLRNDLQSVQARLGASESISRQRGDQINNLMFIIRLLVGELRGHGKSLIVDQAERMLRQMGEMAEEDQAKSTTLYAAEHAEQAARLTVAEVKYSEGGDE